MHSILRIAVGPRKIARELYWIPITTFVINYAFARDLDFMPSVDEYPGFYMAAWK